MEEPRVSTGSADAGDAGGPIAPEALVGRTYYRYKCQCVLGKGAMASVLLGEDIALKRPVAIKLLAHENKANPAHRVWLDQFVREARAAARLMHPGIVQVYDIGIHEGYLYIAMEAMLGGSLEQLVRNEGPLPPDRAVGYVRQVAEALAFAHQRGVLHRDIKPANVLLTEEGRCKLGDFGLAVCDDPKDTFKLPDNFLGTPYFLAPEVLLKLGGPAADVYALGGTLWFLLTGTYPYAVRKLRDALKVGRQIPLGDLRQLCPAAPDDLVALLAKSLARKPQKRYADACEMLSAIDELGKGKKDTELSALASAVRGRRRTAPQPSAEPTATIAQDVPMARPVRDAPASRPRPARPAPRRDYSALVVGFVMIALATGAIIGMVFLVWELMSKPKPVTYIDNQPGGGYAEVDPSPPVPEPLPTAEPSTNTSAAKAGLGPPATRAAPLSMTTPAITPIAQPKEPVLVRQGPGNPIQLPASKAGFTGPGVTLNTRGGQARLLWTDANSHIVWEVNVRKPGNYDVSANVGAGSPTRLKLIVGSKAIEVEVPATGAPGKFTTVPLGRLKIAKGPLTLRLRSAGADFSPVNIIAVVLKKAK